MEIDRFHGREGGSLGAESRGSEVDGDEAGGDGLRRLIARKVALGPDQDRDPDRFEGALPPDPLTTQGSVRYPRGSRATDIAFGSVPPSAGRVETRLRL